jgi:hypothetical protein
MENNPELSLAWRFVENTGENLFLTGKAGTGKTTFLRNLKEHSCKRMVILAPTGIAAINAGGVTIHSFFQLPLAPFVPSTSFNAADRKHFQFSKEKRNIIRSMDLLVIDEISMVRSDLLDAVDDSLRRLRDKYKPFGGVQLLLIGDVQQLAPVVRDSEWEMLKEFYDSPYFFDSNALKGTTYKTIELKNVYRQQDNRFLDLLNRIRENKANRSVLDELNKRYVPNFVPRKEDGYIRLTTHNYQSQQINDRELSLLPGRAMSFKAQVKDDFPEYSYPADETLMLKAGAQIMFLKNDPEHRYYNGMIGNVTYVDEHSIVVLPKDSIETFALEMAEWTNSKYVLDKENNEITEEVMGVFSQYPIRLAWAITIHKSQGLTFDRAIIDAHLSFAHGQTYVALSRCRTLEGMILDAPLSANAIIADEKVDDFNRESVLNTPDNNQLEQLEQEYTLSIMRELFGFSAVEMAYDSVMRLIDESLYKRYPSLLNEYKEDRAILTDMKNVSVSFEQQYTKMLNVVGGDIADENIQKRIYAGADYFISQLNVLIDLYKKTLLSSDNKVIQKRINDRTQMLGEELKIKSTVLTYATDVNNEFSVKGYLHVKAMASIDNDIDKSTKKKKERKPKEKKVKVDTKKVSYDMYLSGATVDQIALDRSLSPTTIENHLAHYVATGEIPIERFVKYKDYCKIIGFVTTHPDDRSSLTAIREGLGNQYSYADIRYALAAFQREDR